jgi:hypothetical protein
VEENHPCLRQRVTGVGFSQKFRHRRGRSSLGNGRLGRHMGITTDGDQGTASKDLVQVPIGPVTRARAKKFKDVLNGLIQELWAQANSWRPNEHDPRSRRIRSRLRIGKKYLGLF